MNVARWLIPITLLSVSPAVAALGDGSLFHSLWPALVAIASIIATRNAITGLAVGVLAAGWLISGTPLTALRETLTTHLFPAIQGPWRTGALVFTLTLGAFAGVLEKSGGFESLLKRVLGTNQSERRLLGGVFAMGLLCFFDGLASSLLTGRIARPLADRAGVSRQRLAWVVDSTGSPIACVAFISTWIATQLSLIQQGLENAPFPVEPYALFFQSIPANPYCLLALMLVPLAILIGWQPAAMRKFKPRPQPHPDHKHPANAPTRVIIIPLAVLVTGILASFPLLSDPIPNILSAAGWRQAFSGNAGPYALVAGSTAGLIAALLWFPSHRRHEAGHAAVQGAGSLLPALLVLILAWTLGSQFNAIGTIDHISDLLADGIPARWLPLAVFLTGSAMAFTTGSSWGTMGLLMPLALPAALAVSSTLPPAESTTIVTMVIGAVFGGATLGDHCSPFSDTTIVSALASGCETLDHVTSQLPFAALAATGAGLAYALMATGFSSITATLIAALALAATVIRIARPCQHPAPPPTKATGKSP
ncbi:MAG: Na+/H+ antiporter NhaC family protein [Verrucomicrobiota bacterium JB025]